MSSQKLSCGTLETQPLSEPLEPVADMQCDDSELSVAGEREEGHSDSHRSLTDHRSLWAAYNPCHISLIMYLSARALATQAYRPATLLSGPL